MGITCGTKFKVNDRFDLQPFLMRRLPIFWIMGPKGCGKKHVACMFEKTSKYNLVNITKLLKDELGKGKIRARVIENYIKHGKNIPDEIIVTLMKEHIFLHYTDAKGFIFCGFPIHLRQAKLFESEICKVSIIIYCTIRLDTLLGRMITKYGEYNTEAVRKNYTISQKHYKVLANYYDGKVLKIVTNHPAEETHRKMIAELEENWGCKFDRKDNRHNNYNDQFI